MKIDRFCGICIKIVLILVIVLLLKSLVALPMNLYAKTNIEYRAVVLSGGANEVTMALNSFAQDGWRLHSAGLGTKSTPVIFERATQ